MPIYADKETTGYMPRREILAGITTFLTMAYIIFVHPEIMSAAGMNKDALIAVTCICSALASILAGLIAKSPIAMAPGMGMNAYFTYSIVLAEGVNWQTALGIVFIAGVAFLLLTAVGLRQMLVDAIPKSIVYAISVGLGLFLTFMGLVSIGIIVRSEATLVTAGSLEPTVIIGLISLVVMILVEKFKVPGALIFGILAGTILALIFGYVELPSRIVTLEIDISPTAFKLDLAAALKWGLAGSIFSLMFIDMFDSIGTVVACSYKAGLVDKEGNIKRLNRMLGVDALSTVFGSLLGTSPVTAYVESAAGIEQGGKTGLTSITTGLLFLLGLIFIPIIAIVPAYATGPALVMVGLFMLKEVTRIDFTNLDEAFPAFIIIVMIALSYSISTGLAFGFISYTLLKTVSWKLKEIKPAMWVIFVLSVLFLAV
jgi:AGZA family xanthine/uracil permease-like MFS transporter